MSRHEHRTVVKRIHPHAWRWRLLFITLVLSACVAGGVWWGLQFAAPSAVVDDGRAALRDQINQLLQQAEADRQAMGELRLNLADQAAEIDELQDMVAFYRGVLAPEQSEAAVVLRAPTLESLGDNRQWRLRLVVHRGEGNDRLYRGELALRIVGSNGAQPQILEAPMLDSGEETGVFPLRFRYLQQVQVVISLPEAFVPETIESVVTLVEPVRETVQRSDLWGDLAEAGPAAQP